MYYQFIRRQTDDNGNEKEYLGVDYGSMDFVLLSAIKEQQEEIEKQNEINTILKEELRLLKETVSTLTHQMARFDIDLQQCCLNHQTVGATGSTQNLDDQPHLAQNVPNPFNQQTIIKYYLPKNSAQSQIRVSDSRGNMLKIFELNESGYGQVNIEASSLVPGTYVYELHVGNSRLDTKRMIILK